MQRCLFDPFLLKLDHDPIDFVFCQHEISHHHRTLAHGEELHVGPKSKSSFEHNPTECHLEIGAWQAKSVDASREQGSGFSHRLVNRFPVNMRG